MRLPYFKLLVLSVIFGGILSAPASAIQWPVQSTTTAHQIYAIYGQLGQDTGGAGYHFHEGTDIAAAAGTSVYAVEGGTIVENAVGAGGSYSQYLTITRGADSTHALGYVHIDYGINPTTGNTWTCGDIVHANDLLGTVATASGIYPHVHFEYDSDVDGYNNCTLGSVAALAGDSLALLSPTSDTTKPVIS